MDTFSSPVRELPSWGSPRARTPHANASSPVVRIALSPTATRVAVRSATPAPAAPRGDAEKAAAPHACGSVSLVRLVAGLALGALVVAALAVGASFAVGASAPAAPGTAAAAVSTTPPDAPPGVVVNVTDPTAAVPVQGASASASLALSSSQTPSQTPSSTPSPSVSASSSPTATPTASASSSSSPLPSQTPSPSPACLADVYVSDSAVPAIYKLPQGDAAQAVKLPAPSLGWSAPKGLFVDHATADVYVADSSQIVIIPGGAGVAQTITDARFTALMDVFIDTQGTLWAADKAAGVFTITTTAGGTTISAVTTATWQQPMAIAVSSAGDVFVSDWGYSGVVKIGAWGTGAVSYITSGLSQPMGLWLAPNNDLYVAEFDNRKVLIFPDGTDVPSDSVNVPMNDQPTDIGGGPRGTFWVSEQNSGGGLFESDSAVGASVGSWGSLQGVWLDCPVGV